MLTPGPLHTLYTQGGRDGSEGMTGKDGEDGRGGGKVQDHGNMLEVHTGSDRDCQEKRKPGI